MFSKTEFDVAASKATNAASAYYDAVHFSQNGEGAMSDSQYDDLIGQIEIATAEHPEWESVESNDLLNIVAGGASVGGDVTHPEPMLSLSKVPTLANVAAFIASRDDRVVIEPKLDGLAVRAVYSGGALHQVVTRGDGQTGEDITSRVVPNPDTSNAVSRVAGLPANVPTDEPFEVRGEVFLTDTDFATANINRTATGKEAFANPRNAAAGALRKENAAYVVPLSFAAYDTVGAVGHHKNASSPNYSERMRTFTDDLGVASAITLLDPAFLGSKGLTAWPTSRLEAVNWIGENRAPLGYPVDGRVIKADSDRAKMGAGSRAPKWAVAFKYAAAESTTVVKDIEFNIGRTGSSEHPRSRRASLRGRHDHHLRLRAQRGPDGTKRHPHRRHRSYQTSQ